MADFCYSCTGEEYGAQNDLRGFAHQNGEQFVFQICEGCGVHAFDNDGRRLCDRDAPEDVAYTVCEQCVTFCGVRVTS